MLHGQRPPSRRWPALGPAHIGPPVSSSNANGETSDEDYDHGMRYGSVVELNKSLHILATIFPRILPEVFREMLLVFHGASRVEIVVDQLLKHQGKWVRGRWRTSAPEATIETTDEQSGELLVAAEDEFRRARYAWAVKSFLIQEFSDLSKSKVDAILAEENYCYTRARSSLQKIASKGWKVAIKTFWASWTKPPPDPSSHYALDWTKSQHAGAISMPVLRETGDAELDMELHCTVLAPLLQKFKARQEAQDRAAAEAWNDMECREASAIYECECCFGETTFERMAACSNGDHVICFQCITHAASEALFGQSWGRNIDHTRGEIRCLAPTIHDACGGSLAQGLVRRAILLSKGGIEMWKRLESRLAEEALAGARIPLIKCPFCRYAEIDELYLPRQSIQFRSRVTDIKSTVFLTILTFNFLPIVLLYTLLCRFTSFSSLPCLTILFSTSLTRLCRSRHMPMRFQCRSPSCGHPSCLRCFKVWRDPHVCHESANLSLRTTIESARTAALKRTCPQCGLAFVKDSGCNKLTCVCGYTMCYVCRQGLGKGEGGEGYRHFCQHFRPQGGMCRECDKCDLYKNLDDDGYIKEAGAKAEKEWREKEGMVDVAGLGGDQDADAKKSWPRLGWNPQDLMDLWVANLITC